MQKTYNTQPILKTLTTAKNVLILLPQNPSLDTVAAGLALHLSLTKKQLMVTIGCDTPMTVNFNRLFGVDKIKQRIGNQNLVISFIYPEDSLEKVSYDKDPQNQKFHLTIEPKAGKQPLDSNQVEYSYTGSNADLIFIIGARSLEDLGHLYQQEKTLLNNQKKTIVNLSTLDKNAQFGTVNLYDPTASGCSEIAFSVLKALSLPLEQDIATNLLAGIEKSTNNFATAKSADTFAVTAELIRLGAKKGYISTLPTPSLRRPFTPLSSTPQSSNQRPNLQSLLNKQVPITSNQLPPLPVNPPTPQSQVTPIEPQPLPKSQPLKSVSQSTPNLVSNRQDLPLPDQSLSEQTSSRQPSPDWLKPKVVTTSNPKI